MKLVPDTETLYWLRRFLEQKPNAADRNIEAVLASRLDLDPSQPKELQVIAGSAVVFNGTEVWSLCWPARHHHLQWSASGRRNSGDEEPPTLIPGEQGFVTTSGRFVTREEGWTIAEKHGQLTLKVHRETGKTDFPVPGTLFSEDLW